MKTAVYTFLLIIVFSCKNSTENTETKVTDQLLEENELNLIADEAESHIEDLFQEVTEGDFKNHFDILLPGEYRDWEAENPVNNISKSWIELYKKESKYYLDKANYSIESGYSECSGDSTKILKSKNENLLFLNHATLKLGEVQTINIDKNKIWPQEKISFNFNDIIYTIRAEGDVLSSQKVPTDEGEEIYQDVENYKLYISSNKTSETLFLEQDSFNDKFVELLFIGDLDTDGKPDFIFGANRDYEEERVLLYLSSQAKEGSLIEKVSEIAIQSDC
ncbi:MAG: hypothetical protein ABI295_10890 [Xanthomarina sp.]